MIRIEIQTREAGAGAVEIRIRADGHAGYAEKGKDIVCAAVSAGLDALAYYAMAEDADAEVDARDGDMGIRFTVDDTTGGKMLTGAFNAFVGLMGRMKDEYPDHVDVVMD